MYRHRTAAPQSTNARGVVEDRGSTLRRLGVLRVNTSATARAWVEALDRRHALPRYNETDRTTQSLAELFGQGFEINGGAAGKLLGKDEDAFALMPAVVTRENVAAAVASWRAKINELTLRLSQGPELGAHAREETRQKLRLLSELATLASALEGLLALFEVYPDVAGIIV